MRKIYDKVVAVLSAIPTDKYIHCIVVMIIASVFMHILPFGLLLRFVISVVLAITVGICKELYDKKDYGLFDTKDLCADAIGALLGALMSI